MRVLHVIPSVSLKRGGPSQAVIEMAGSLKRVGVDIELATTNDDGDKLLDVALNDLQEYRGVPTRFFKRFSPPLQFVREFAISIPFTRWLFRNVESYDLIHIHAAFSFCSSAAMWIARRKGVPYVVRTIGQLEPWSLKRSNARKSMYLALIEKKNLLGAHWLHCTAESEQANLPPWIDGTCSRVMPIGIELPIQIASAGTKLRKRFNINSGATILLSLSRLHPKKNIENLLKAVHQLKNHQGVDFHVLIAGSGDQKYENDLQNLVAQLDLGSLVTFTGFVVGTQKHLLLQGCDLFVLASHSENFGIAALEALAHGTAVLLSQNVALAKQVNTEQLGFVCQTSVQSIRSHVEAALSDSGKLAKMGIAARALVEQHHQWLDIAKSMTKAYRDTLDPPTAFDLPTT